MKVKNIIVRLVILIVSVVLSHFMAFPLGKWIQDRVAVVSHEFYVGAFPGYLDGLMLSYVFFSSLLFPLYTQRVKSGFYWTLPALLLLLLSGSLNPQLWISLILLAAGLGLAYLILLLTRKLAR